MKLGKEEHAAIAVASADAKKTAAKIKRLEATIRKLELEQKDAKDVWHQATKIIVPTWFGQNDVIDGLALGESFTAAGALALVAVGQACRESDEVNQGTSEVGMQMKLRPSGFDRQEARRLAERGFIELRQHRLIRLRTRRRSKAETLGELLEELDKTSLETYVLSAKGEKWFSLIERSAGCAKEPARGKIRMVPCIARFSKSTRIRTSSSEGPGAAQAAQGFVINSSCLRDETE